MSPASSDVVVVGGGPAGSATALRLARSGCDVRLVTGAPGDGSPEGQVLAAVGRRALRQLGLWEEFLALGFAASYGTMSSWGGDEVVERSSVFNADGPDWMVRREAFDGMLLSRARRDGVRLHRGSVITAETDGSGWGLRLRDSGRATDLDTRIVIDATGRRALLARRFGRREATDRLIGVRYWLPEPPAGTQPVLTVESTPDGWWYSVPASHGGLTVFEMTDRDLWRRELSGERFAATTLTRQRCGGQAIAAGLGVFPAATVMHRVDTPGLLAVGDAAIARDPLAAEGLCFALVSAREAADTAAAMLAGDSRRQGAYTEGLSRVFAEHLEQRSHVYAGETRWADRPFWQRRSKGADSGVRLIPRRSATRRSSPLTMAS